MWNYIEEILSCFENSFSRMRAYKWFAVIIIGIMARTDHLGFTSVIRDLCLAPGCYEPMMHFFRSSAWTLDGIQRCWYGTVATHIPLARLSGRTVLVGDGMKQPKEGRHMPSVKRLAQEPEAQTKPEMIYGHMWGCVGILVGNPVGPSCLPLSMRLHDGLKAVRGWADKSVPSHIVQMVRDGCAASPHFGDCLYLLDRYFLSVTALRELALHNASGRTRVDIITKAKPSAVAWFPPEPRKPGDKGRPKKKGKGVHLADMFRDRASSFKTGRMSLYGKRQPVRYMHMDLLWGKGLYQKLCFVLVEYGSTRSILACTDLRLSPRDIIQAYGRRFRIETSFRAFKQHIGGMAYHFWTKALPRLSHYARSGGTDPMLQVGPGRGRRRITDTVRATEMAVLMSCIAMGILQDLSIRSAGALDASVSRYQRTPVKAKPSEDNMMCCAKL